MEIREKLETLIILLRQKGEPMKVRKIADFVHQYLMETGKNELDSVWGHKYRWEHTLRVPHWVWQLAVEEKADIEKCVIAALLHDFSNGRENVRFRFSDNLEFSTSKDEILLSTSFIFNMVRPYKIRHFQT